jgi:hypothetical protein
MGASGPGRGAMIRGFRDLTKSPSMQHVVSGQGPRRFRRGSDRLETQSTCPAEEKVTASTNRRISPFGACWCRRRAGRHGRLGLARGGLSDGLGSTRLAGGTCGGGSLPDWDLAHVQPHGAGAGSGSGWDRGLDVGVRRQCSGRADSRHGGRSPAGGASEQTAGGNEYPLAWSCYPQRHGWRAGGYDAGAAMPPTGAQATSGDLLVFDFSESPSGTQWFHPHHGLQPDHGLYARLIVEDPPDAGANDAEWVLVLDDWTDGVGPPTEAFYAGLAGVQTRHGSTWTPTTISGLDPLRGVAHQVGAMSGMSGMGVSRRGMHGMGTGALEAGGGDVDYPLNLISSPAGAQARAGCNRSRSI